ncbi:MAG: glycosyltransferase, partial [Candidatus Bipolaricaulota bacterium]|nr:glycosyltransferase [Candidatus Bipolaricaulota bacterium]
CSPGVREYLDDGRAGVLVPPGDPRALAGGVERLLSDELLRRELARRGRERIAQFDLSAAAGAYEKLLERL